MAHPRYPYADHPNVTATEIMHWAIEQGLTMSDVLRDPALFRVWLEAGMEDIRAGCLHSRLRAVEVD